jgi:hypothetical protein
MRRNHGSNNTIKFPKDDARPFAFEDLDVPGLANEPSRWGKKYPATLDRSKGIGAAIRKLQRRELCGDARLEVDLSCKRINTCKGSDNTQAGDDARYAEWIVKLLEIRIAKQALINVGRGPAYQREAAIDAYLNSAGKPAPKARAASKRLKSKPAADRPIGQRSRAA